MWCRLPVSGSLDASDPPEGPRIAKDFAIPDLHEARLGVSVQGLGSRGLRFRVGLVSGLRSLGWFWFRRGAVADCKSQLSVVNSLPYTCSVACGLPIGR